MRLKEIRRCENWGNLKHVITTETVDLNELDRLARKVDNGDYSVLDKLVRLIFHYYEGDNYLPYIKLAAQHGDMAALNYYYSEKSRELRKAREKRHQKNRWIIFVAIAVVAAGVFFQHLLICMLQTKCLILTHYMRIMSSLMNI